MTIRLPVDLYSTDQLSAAMLELREYSNALHDIANRKRISRNAEEMPHTSALLLALFHGAGVRAGDHDSAAALLKDLENIRAQAVIAHIALAALPTRTLKRQLIVWFRSEIHPFTFLTFAMRSDLGGGLIVQAGSQVYDFSFRETLLAHKARIGEIFNSVR